jgi:hypothetical protein
MKYVFVDTDNGGTPSNTTPDTSTSIYHTTSTWPANGARWSGLSAALANATIAAITDDVTILCRGSADDTLSGEVASSGKSFASLTIEGDFAAAAPDATKYLMKATGTQQRLFNNNKAATNITFKNLQISFLSTSTSINIVLENSVAATLTIDSCYIILNGSGTSTSYGVNSNNSSSTINCYNTIIRVVNSSGTVNGIRRGTGTTNVYNCVLRGPGSAGVGCVSSVGGTAVNCAVFDWSDDFNFSGSISYCASDDGDGTNAITAPTWANQFEDYVNGDFRLKAGSSFIGAGLDDPASGAFSDDIAGTTRSDWDIGAFEYVTATGLTITSVNTTNTAFSAQTDSAVVGTGLSASVVCTYAGIACTNESASSSTSLKITFPNFFTNNIKLGRNYEFKVIG